MKLKINNKQKIIIILSSLLFCVMVLYAHFGLKVLISDEQYLMLGLKNLLDSKSLELNGGLVISNSKSSDEFINVLSQVNLDISTKLNHRTWDMDSNIGVRLFDSSEKLFDANIISNGEKIYLDLKKYIDKIFEIPVDLKQIKALADEFFKEKSSFNFEVKTQGYEDIYSNFIHYRYYITYLEFSYDIQDEKLLYGRASEYEHPVIIKFYQDMSGQIKRVALSCEIERVDQSKVDQYELGFDVNYLGQEFKSHEVKSDMILDEKGIKYIFDVFKDKVL